jgi:hypothetical protein
MFAEVGVDAESSLRSSAMGGKAKLDTGGEFPRAIDEPELGQDSVSRGAETKLYLVSESTSLDATQTASSGTGGS